MSASSLRVVVLGYVVRGPLGGMAWSDLRYLESLVAAGHDVFYTEDSDDYPSCYDPRLNETTEDPTYGLAFAHRELEACGLSERWSYHDAHTGSWHGPQASLGPGLFSDADVLLNLAGVNPLRPWALEVPARVLVDQDPAFTQIRHLTDDRRRDSAGLHNSFATFAMNFGTPRCSVPIDGFPWRATRQPVIVDDREIRVPRPHAPFTTVMQWESYPSPTYEGRVFGMKSMSFEKYKDLPGRVDVDLEVAVGAPDEIRAEMERLGWRTRDPRGPTTDTSTYEDYIRASGAEFGIAKHGYVASRSGWFSERSLAYMLNGRPVAVEDTGFSDWLPTGKGVLGFSNLEEAAAAVGSISNDAASHSEAARDLVYEYFDGRAIVNELLQWATEDAP